MNWMAWTPQTAIFFACIAIALGIMTAWELASPTKAEKGFLPMPTTRGDRFFISLLSAAFIHISWLALVGELLPVASGIALVMAILIMRQG
jgi:predicted small integral membrane protein